MSNGVRLRTIDLAAPTKLILDTHIWIWHAEGEAARYAVTARQAIEVAAQDGRAAVSAISAWELAMLEQKGTVTLSAELRRWIAETRRPPGVRVLPLSLDVLIDGPRLPRWFKHGTRTEHRDPADRWIVATARQTNATIITCDEEILHYAGQGHVHAFDARP